MKANGKQEHSLDTTDCRTSPDGIRNLADEPECGDFHRAQQFRISSGVRLWLG